LRHQLSSRCTGDFDIGDRGGEVLQAHGKVVADSWKPGTLRFFSLIMAALSWTLPVGVSMNAMESVIERKKFEENLFWIGLNNCLSLEKLELL
jgi:hypothetical protein